MQLRQALRLGESEMVTFVGGGGKTTAMFRLAAEIVAAGGRVLTSTTTRIFAAQIRLAPVHVSIDAAGRFSADLDLVVAANPHVLLTGPIAPQDGKTASVPPEVLSEIAARYSGLTVLIEADGSRMRPFKAPADHEPVIPAQATLVVPIVGSDVLGLSLDEHYVHRPDVVRQLLGVGLGETVTPQVVAGVLAHPGGGRKSAPPGARIVPLINKVDLPGTLLGAREIARLLTQNHAIDSVVLGNVASEEPAAEVWSRISAVVLAAGGSSRMGQLKQLLPWGESTLVEQAVGEALASQAAEVIVVTGCEAARVGAAMAGRPLRLVENPAWAQGQSTSVRAGLAAVSPGSAGAIFLLADQPFVSAKLVDALIQRHRETLAPLVAPRSNGRRGNPVLFDKVTWGGLSGVAGDAGGRGLFEAYRDRVGWVEWDESIMADVDTPEEYRALNRSAAR